MRVIGYCRVSTDVQIERDSISSQLELITRFCKSSNLNLTTFLKDEGVSGTLPLEKREGGKQLLKQLRDRSIDGVVITKLDRAFRNAGEALVTLDNWSKCGYAVFILNFMNGSKLDTRDPASKAMLGMMSVFAQFERDMIAQRVREQMAIRKANKSVYCRKIFGFDNVDGKLVPNPQEQKAVRLILHLRKNGYSLGSIASILEKRGYKTARGSNKWYKSSIESILKNDIHFHTNPTNTRV